VSETCSTCKELPWCSWENGAHPDDPVCINYRKAVSSPDDRIDVATPHQPKEGGHAD